MSKNEQAQTVPFHEFLLKLLRELTRGMYSGTDHSTQHFVAKMVAEVAIPEKHKDEVTGAFLEFIASGYMHTGLIDEFAKAYRRLDPDCTDPRLGNLRALSEKIGKVEVKEKTADVPARPV